MPESNTKRRGKVVNNDEEEAGERGCKGGGIEPEEEDGAMAGIEESEDEGEDDKTGEVRPRPDEGVSLVRRLARDCSDGSGGGGDDCWARCVGERCVVGCDWSVVIDCLAFGVLDSYGCMFTVMCFNPLDRRLLTIGEVRWDEDGVNESGVNGMCDCEDGDGVVGGCCCCSCWW